MRHRIGDIIHTYTNAQRGVLLGILGVVGMLPRTAPQQIFAEAFGLLVAEVPVAHLAADADQLTQPAGRKKGFAGQPS
jgi:hypothetical protein